MSEIIDLASIFGALFRLLLVGDASFEAQGGLYAELKFLARVYESVQNCYIENAERSPYIEEAIVACQRDLVKLSRKLKKQETGSRLSKLSATFKWIATDSSKYSLILKRHSETLAHISSELQLSKSKAIEKRIEEQTQANMETLALSKEMFEMVRDDRTKLLNWLYPGAYDETHIKIQRRRQPNTGLWILKTPEFLDWKENRKTLCGYGIPGAGKTFLSSLVIDYLLGEGHAVAYVYFRREARNSQKTGDILSNLAKQLCCQLPQVPSSLDHLYHRLRSSQGRPTFEDLNSIIKSLSRSLPRTFIVCDALDECHQEVRKELFPLFRLMNEDGYINLFLSSRDYLGDIRCFVRESAIKIRLSVTKEDIACYVENKINERPRTKDLVEQAQCKDRIVSCLTDYAKGMFLLVDYHMEYICQQTSSKQILMELERIQNNSCQEWPLDPTYDTAMEIIRSQSRNCVNLTLSILSWLVKSQRPLTLGELLTAISIEPERYELEAIDLPDTVVILDVCAGLVTIDERNSIVQLVHPTLQEYLLRKSIISRDADFQHTMACITYLSFKVFAPGACKSDSTLRSRYATYPFLEYAAKHLAPHLKACDEDLSTPLLLTFLNNPGNVNTYMQAAYAYPKLTTQDSGVSDDGDYNAYPKGRNPLHVAATLGHYSVVRVLLESINIGTLDSKGRSAIHLATSEGHESVVQLLLLKGANPFLADSDGITALRWAETKGQLSIVRLMQQKRSSFLHTDTMDPKLTTRALPLRNKHLSVADINAVRVNTRSPKVDRYKLETAIYEDCVVHTTYKTDLATRERKAAVEETWTRKKEIGVGGFGVVSLEEERGGKLRAVKQLPLALRDVDYSQELNTLVKLTDYQHLFVQFFGWYEDSRFLYIAMEFVEYGDLSQYIENGSARLKVREITRQLLEGVAVLHEKQICHRDLKPQNILVACIEPIWVKISDFGVSKREKNSNLYTQLGTRGYLAPELLGLLPRCFGMGRSYTNAVDLWALGCIVHEILTTEMPFLEIPYLVNQSGAGLFSDQSTEALVPQIDMILLLDYCRGTIEFPTETLETCGISQEGINFIKSLLVVDPRSRVSAIVGLRSLWIMEEEDNGAPSTRVAVEGAPPSPTNPQAPGYSGWV